MKSADIFETSARTIFIEQWVLLPNNSGLLHCIPMFFFKTDRKIVDISSVVTTQGCHKAMLLRLMTYARTKRCIMITLIAESLDHFSIAVRKHHIYVSCVQVGAIAVEMDEQIKQFIPQVTRRRWSAGTEQYAHWLRKWKREGMNQILYKKNR